MRKSLLIYLIILNFFNGKSQSIEKTMLRLPDTGETISYTNTFGEDSDYSINPPFFIKNGNGTVTDTVTGLMWQQTDGGEMTVENAKIYCDTLSLAGFTDWRLPNAHEAFSILNHQNANPALDINVFTKTTAEYWWTITRQVNDLNKIWVTNAGGGIGNHSKSETISAGGTKKFHVRAVRNINTPVSISEHFIDNGNGTITDKITNLIWEKTAKQNALNWEEALIYAENLDLANSVDWRMPNIKELQSINDEGLIEPSINTNYFSNIGVKKYWSSTTLPNQIAKAWYLDTQFGITTYDNKTIYNYIICVRGGNEIISNVKFESIYNSSNLIAFPNPFTTSIHIKDYNDNITYELYSLYNNLIYSGNNIEKQDFSFLPIGMYILKSKGKTNSSIIILKE